jgi:hypothetical protein
LLRCERLPKTKTKQETKVMKQKTGFRIVDSLSTVHRSLFTVHCSLSTVHRSLSTLLTLSLLAAFAPRAEATVSAWGGLAQNYWQNGTNYIVHTFTTVGSNSFNVTSGGNVEVLVMAGGGGGGGYYSQGGGGGAGGLIYSNRYVVAGGSNYTVTVGAGGDGATTNAIAKNGNHSIFATMTAIGGGHGGSYNGAAAEPLNSRNGGSGGGGAWQPNNTGGTFTVGQGYAGGNGGSTADPYWQAGGGGAGGAGGNGTGATSPGNSAGGIGVQYSQFAGMVASTAGGLQDGWFGGGGGGSRRSGTYDTGGAGGTGGGGNGGNNGRNGLDGTGGGGGGGDVGSSPVGGKGGSGIVIVRYAVPLTPYQMKIAFGGYTNRSEVLTNFPVLVVFSNNVNNSGFNYGLFYSTKGYDLRFGTNATPTTNSLNYEIESWNPNGTSYVWVQVPTIPTDGSGAIWANWHNDAASNQLACTTNGAVWTDQYAAVYHLATTGGVRSAADATTRNNGTITGTVNTITGQIDGGASVTNSGANRIDVANSTSLRIANKITLSGWINWTHNVHGAAMIIKRNKNDTPKAEENYAMWVLGNSNLYWETSGKSLHSPNNLVTPGVWTYVAIAVDDSVLTKLTMYVNGSAVTNHTVDPSLVAYSSPLNIGNFDGYDNKFQTGGLDELRISPYTHSSNWVWACYQTMASNTVFNSYGKMEAIIPPPKGTLIMMR